MIHINPISIDIAVILGIITITTISSRFLYKITRFLDHLNCMLSVWDGTENVPGVIERLNKIEKQLSDVQYHVKPNHGNSSVDAQNRQLQKIISYLEEKNNE